MVADYFAQDQYISEMHIDDDFEVTPIAIELYMSSPIQVADA